jgi:hypothetical protein
MPVGENANFDQLESRRGIRRRDRRRAVVQCSGGDSKARNSRVFERRQRFNPKLQRGIERWEQSYQSEASSSDLYDWGQGILSTRNQSGDGLYRSRVRESDVGDSGSAESGGDSDSSWASAESRATLHGCRSGLARPNTTPLRSLPGNRDTTSLSAQRLVAPRAQRRADLDAPRVAASKVGEKAGEDPVDEVARRVRRLEAEMAVPEPLRIVQDPFAETDDELLAFLQIKIGLEKLTVANLMVARKLGEAWLNKNRMGMSEQDKKILLDWAHRQLTEPDESDRLRAAQMAHGFSWHRLHSDDLKNRVDSVNLIRQGIRRQVSWHTVFAGAWRVALWCLMVSPLVHSVHLGGGYTEWDLGIQFSVPGLFPFLLALYGTYLLHQFFHSNGLVYEVQVIPDK